MFSLNSSVLNVKKKSEKILNIFTKTVDELIIVNKEIDSLSEQKTIEKQKIEADLSELYIQKEANTAIVNKINNLLNN